jgi:hypothetical protein
MAVTWSITNTEYNTDYGRCKHCNIGYSGLLFDRRCYSDAQRRRVDRESVQVPRGSCAEHWES